jgi:hypothetical protein
MSGVSNSWRMGETRCLTTPSTHRDTHHRFPAELIRPAVGRYCRCCRTLLPQLPRSRSAAVRPWNPRHVRGHPPGVVQVRSTVCHSTAAPTSPVRRPMAPGRRLPPAQWPTACPGAGGGAGREGPGDARAAPPRPNSRQAVLSEAAERVSVRPTSARHRAAETLWGGEAGATPWC